MIPIFNSPVFKCNIPSYLLPKQINTFLLLCHCKFGLCWRGLLKAPFLGVLPIFLRIFVSSEGPLHPYYPPHPDLKLIFSLLYSFSVSILVKFLSSLDPWQTVYHDYSYWACPQSLSLHISTDFAFPTGSQKCWCQQEHVSDEIHAHLRQDSIICSPS